MMKKILVPLSRVCLVACLVNCGGGGSSGGNNSPVNNPPPSSGLEPGPPLDGTRPSNATCLAVPRPTSVGAQTVVLAFPSLDLQLAPGDRLTGLKQLPGNNDFWYVADRAGRLLRFAADDSVTSATTALNISARLTFRPPPNETEVAGEGGLLGFAFSPDFAANGIVYVSYMSVDHVRISRFVSSNGGETFNANNEQIIFEHNKQNDYHNAGDLHFDANG